MPPLARFQRQPGWLFSVTVIIPVVLSTVYFGLLASDVYISESQFVVRSPEKPAASGLGMLLQGAGFSNAAEEVFTAKEYAASRDALRELNRNDAYRKAYTRPEISIFDRFNPLGGEDSFEHLYKYYSSHVRIDADPTTSISKLTVRAYTAEDAYRINRQLIEMSEAKVNSLNKRGQKDLVRYASDEVATAKKQAENAAIALARLRDQSGIIDPEKQAEIQMQMISKLQDELIAAKTQLAQLRTFTPDNPQIPTFRKQIATIETEIDRQAGLMAGNRSSLASSAVEFQRRILDNQMAEKQLASVLASLEDAKSEARRQEIYVERLVSPNMPDAPLEPRRVRGIFATLVVGLAAWGVLSMLLAGVREHGN